MLKMSDSAQEKVRHSKGGKMRNRGKTCLSVAMAAFLVFSAGEAQTSSDLPVYVTRQDCSLLVSHHPDPGVNYTPGSDVHGKYVAPADLPGGASFNLPDKITFDLRVNPLAYGAQAAQSTPGGKFANTNIPVAHLDVDLLSGAAKLNGQPLDGEQTRIVTDACRKAGFK